MLATTFSRAQRLCLRAGSGHQAGAHAQFFPTFPTQCVLTVN